MTSPLVDTHAHLCDPAFNSDVQSVIRRALHADVAAVVAVGENLKDARRNLALAAEFPVVKPAAGLYPVTLDREAAAAMAAFIREKRERLFAIGEVGLDFWMVKAVADRELQRRIFEMFIRLSTDLDLPLNVHSRSAGRHVVELLLEKGARKVQLHAFDGKFTAARPAVEAGYFFSVPPSVVRSRQKQKLVRHLPLDCLLLESDSPVLGPDPGVRNEPASLPAALDTIAAIKGLPAAELADIILENTRKLYPGLL